MKSSRTGLLFVILIFSLIACNSGVTPDPPPVNTGGWGQSWGGSYIDAGREVAIDHSGNIYVWGEVGDTVDLDPGPGVETISTLGGTDFCLTKFDHSGTFLWARTWGNEYDDGNRTESISIDDSDNVYVSSSFRGTVDFDPGPGLEMRTSNGNRDTYLSKFNSDGVLQWVRTWGGAEDDSARGNAVYRNDFIYASGGFKGVVDFDPGPDNYDLESKGDWDVFISKFDSNGNFLWARVWGGELEDAVMEVAVDSAGNACVTGLFQANGVDFDPDPDEEDLHDSHGNGVDFEYDAFLSKIDPSGDLLWAETWGGPDWDKGVLLAVDRWDNIYVTGYFSEIVDFDTGPGLDEHISKGKKDAFLAKFDRFGTFLWARSWGSIVTNLGEWGRGVAVDDAGNAYVTGGFAGFTDFDPGPAVDMHSPVGGMDIFISKFDPEGNYLWARQWGSEANEMGRGVAVDGFGNAYVTGWFRLSADFDPGPDEQWHRSNGFNDAFLVKFTPDGDW